MERDIKPTYDELESYIDRLDRQRADAQATIAALQADNRTYINERHENMKQIEQLQAMNNRLGVRVETLQSQLTQRTAERDTARRRVDELEAREVDVVMLREDLEQRTAELERVRGELADERTAYKALSEQHNKLDIEHNDLCTLIAALPKVEGEIRERFCTGSYYSSPHDYRSHVTFETALVALLKHRQGMEG